MSNEKNKVSYKDTLNLPRTEFPIRPNFKENDPRILQRWAEQGVYEKTFYAHAGSEKFVLHDGPPYANGNIHLGTSANKILKDFAAKGKRMQGKQVPITPGWDCHGLPIELKVTKESGALSPDELIKECREYAKTWVTTQREQFKALGVMMNWDHPYLTMNYDYEAKILRAFGVLVRDGYIERNNKTVPWCASCQTVLAAAEIEYYDRKDPSIYVLFSLNSDDIERVLPKFNDKPVELLIWTTTPWTLALNRAVLVHPKMNYQVVDVGDKYVIIATECVNKLAELIGFDKNVKAQVKGEIFKGTKANHPFIEGLQVPIVFNDLISPDEGTALVHCAPGCGPEDYEIGIRNQIEIFSPITADGKYSEGIKPDELKGMSVFDGQIWALKKLHALGRLFYKCSIRHPYPHCWRCRNGLIFRATKQWFCDLTKHDLKKRAISSLEHIKMIPKKSENRLKASMESRLEWCLSRQRLWGVPIPALLCTECDYVYLNEELVEKVAFYIEKEGIEYWQHVKIDELVSTDFKCPQCSSKKFKKEMDILDVWFDSGVSHFSVLKGNQELSYPADLYIEAKDQHRGWFQSSLLTSMAIEENPCTNAIITHGFTVDQHGRKMSKSVGNVVAPSEVIEKIGTDGLRLWMASLDYTDDLVISDKMLKNVAEVYRKIRNTCRFMLSNLYDFDIRKDAVEPADMLLIDKYALHTLFELNNRIIKHYNDYDFTAVYREFVNYSTVELSSFYLDIIKDRLYIERADGLLRRSAQTCCWHILDMLTRAMAPILSFAAEQLSDFYQKDKSESIHLQTFADLQSIWGRLCEAERSCGKIESDELVAQSYENRWNGLKTLRSAILKLIEEQREKGLIKHSLESSVTLYFDPNSDHYTLIKNTLDEAQKNGQVGEKFLKEFLIVSNVTCVDLPHDLNEIGMKGVYARVDVVKGVKCPRCWQWEETSNQNGLCSRCKMIIDN